MMSEKTERIKKEAILKAATKAATEATQVERLRCIWVLDELVKRVQKSLGQKLVTAQDRHVQELKFKITQSMVQMASADIMRGHRPELPINALPQVVYNVEEMSQRMEQLSLVLEELGYGDKTVSEIRARLDHLEEIEIRHEDFLEKLGLADSPLQFPGSPE